MKNLWYVSRDNEIFIDTDNFSRSIKHTNSRLLGAIECSKLDVLNVEFHESYRQNHVHTIITLKNPMPALERYTWSIILHSDIYRSASTLMRYAKGVLAPDVLITPIEFLRKPDDFCKCEGKHSAEVMQHCHAAIRLRREHRITSFFGLPSKQKRNLF